VTEQHIRASCVVIALIVMNYARHLPLISSRPTSEKSTPNARRFGVFGHQH